MPTINYYRTYILIIAILACLRSNVDSCDSPTNLFSPVVDDVKTVIVIEVTTVATVTVTVVSKTA